MCRYVRYILARSFGGDLAGIGDIGNEAGLGWAGIKELGKGGGGWFLQGYNLGTCGRVVWG